MAIDPRIQAAIDEAVKEAGQPKALTKRLAAWFEAVTVGNEDINDLESASRHLEVLFEGVVVESAEGEEG